MSGTDMSSTLRGIIRCPDWCSMSVLTWYLADRSRGAWCPTAMKSQCAQMRSFGFDFPVAKRQCVRKRNCVRERENATGDVSGPSVSDLSAKDASIRICICDTQLDCDKRRRGDARNPTQHRWMLTRERCVAAHSDCAECAALMEELETLHCELRDLRELRSEHRTPSRFVLHATSHVLSSAALVVRI
eukprot:2630804-Rhodomonas_salina.6